MLAAVVLALALVPAAAASEEQPTLEELEKELICPTCNALLALSDAPVADQIRALIRERIDAGDTKSEIKAVLVEEFGEAVLAAPPREGLNLLAWALPLVGIAAAAVAVWAIARRWIRSDRRRGPPGGDGPGGSGPLDPELEKRLDDELARLDA
jgi:cytochrome c-type biogenesis protein CcmH